MYLIPTAGIDLFSRCVFFFLSFLFVEGLVIVQGRTERIKVKVGQENGLDRGLA